MTTTEKILHDALTQITKLGGNLPDEALETKTGPNDAVSRGIMYTSARRIANEALGKFLNNESAQTI